MARFLDIFKKDRYVSLSNQDSRTSDSLEKLLAPTGEEEHTRGAASGVTLTWWRASCLLVAWVLTTTMMSLWLNALSNSTDMQRIGLKSLEFKDTERWIEKEIVTFTGAPIFEENGYTYREFVPGIKQYIGNTSDIQDNWEELLRDRYFLVSEEEMKAIYPHDYQDYYHTDLGWWVGLDGYHILHCINIVRKALNKLRAGDVDNSHYQTYHEDHCIDLIRQSVSCNMDLTVIPERRWHRPGPAHFIDSNQKHVCRNVWTIRKFLDMRQKRTDDLIADYEAKTGKLFREHESAMGVFGFPERKGHEMDYRPPYLRTPNE